MKEIQCDWCGEATEKYQSNITENNFCSRSCYNEWNAEQKTGSGNPMWSGGKETVSCDGCGSEIKRYPFNIHDNNFCSNSCRLEWFEEEHGQEWPVMIGEDNPHWSGGYDQYYGENWNAERNKALDNADYQCRICGMTRDECYDVYGMDLDVHHKIPHNNFDIEEEANFQDNLVVACRSCHRSKLERNPVPHNSVRAPQ